MEGFLGGVDDGLSHDVEGGVEEDGDASELLEVGEELVVAGVGFLGDGLDASGAVDVGDGGDAFAHVGEDVVDEEHEGGGVAAFEVFVGVAVDDAGGEGSEFFSEFYAGVYFVLHVGACGVGEDGACAECAGSEFHASLVPADDVALGEAFGGGLGDVGGLGVGMG